VPGTGTKLWRPWDKTARRLAE